MTNDFKIKNGLQLGGALTENVGTISGNADLDLSTGNVFSYTPTADATFAFSNAGETEHSFVLSVTGAEVSSIFDLANASFDNKTFNVTSQETYSKGLTFGNEGSKMYIVGESGDSVFQYTLSTPWDVSTASYDSVSLSGLSNPRGVALNNDGTKLYVLLGASLNQYILSTPWDISTASASTGTSFGSENFGGQDVAFNNDGSKLYYVADSSTVAVYQYTLETPFDPSTKTYDNVSFNLGGQALDATAMEVSPDGLSILIMGRAQDTVFKYTLSTPFDISTMSYSNISFNVSAAEATPWGMTTGDSGTKMYILGSSNNTVNQYTITSTPAPATFTYPASVAWPSGTAPDAPAVGETDILEFSTTDGGTTWYGVRSGDALA